MLPHGASYKMLCSAVSPTQVQDPLRLPGWTKVMIGLADEERGDLAVSVLRWAEEVGGFRLDNPLYAAAITACERSGLWQQALELHSEMARKAVPLNVVSYNAAMASFARGARWQSAVALMEEVRQPSPTEPKGLKLDDIAYNTLINACAKGAQWRAALRMLSSMHKSGVQLTVISYSTAIDACLKAKMPQYAGLLFDSMEQEGVEPNYFSAELRRRLASMRRAG